MELSEFFSKNNKAAIAFSGGVDSAYLLYAAVTNNAMVRPYYVKSAFQPQFELDDAKRIAQKLHIEMEILEVDILSEPIIAQNPINRCYYCKKRIFSEIKKAAEKDGYSLLLDGTNASDSAEERPGMRVMKELSVCSPLRECGLKKEDIRRLSKEAGLFTWNKPAYACLATRIASETEITREKLAKTEAAEDFLFSLGFTDFRIRMLRENTAKLQVPLHELEKVLENREIIINNLKKYYSSVLLDLEVRNE